MSPARPRPLLRPRPRVPSSPHPSSTPRTPTVHPPTTHRRSPTPNHPPPSAVVAPRACILPALPPARCQTNPRSVERTRGARVCPWRRTGATPTQAPTWTYKGAGTQSEAPRPMRSIRPSASAFAAAVTIRPHRRPWARQASPGRRLRAPPAPLPLTITTHRPLPRTPCLQWVLHRRLRRHLLRTQRLQGPPFPFQRARPSHLPCASGAGV